MKRRSILTALGVAVLGAGSTDTWADDKIVRFVVPYAPGGQTDIIARMMAESMQKTLARTIIVENRPGAAALIATRYVQSATPDGDTVLFHNSGLVILPLVQKGVGYDPVKDFDPVAMTGVGPNFLMVHESLPAHTVPEFLAYARSRPEPLNCANSGTNSGGHISAMLLEKLAHIRLNHIPFKGSSEVATALISGEVKMQVSVTTDALAPYIKSGKIRLLGVTTKERTALAPDVPTLGEFVPGYAIDGWFGVLAPAHTPLAKRETMAHAIKIALDDPAVRARFAQLYMEPKFRDPAQFKEDIASSVATFKKVVDIIGLKPQ
jgi:tripartite-type tricarboxylate transporter receptor subunit TctC